jgi:hypothetical protein
MATTSKKETALKKLKALSDYQKLKQVLDKESDKLNEVKAKGKEKEEITKIKKSLNKK